MAKLKQHRTKGTYYTQIFKGGIVTRQIHPDGVAWLKQEGMRLDEEISAYHRSVLESRNWLFTLDEIATWGEVDWAPDWNSLPGKREHDPYKAWVQQQRQFKRQRSRKEKARRIEAEKALLQEREADLSRKRERAAQQQAHGPAHLCKLATASQYKLDTSSKIEANLKHQQYEVSHKDAEEQRAQEAVVQFLREFAERGETNSQSRPTAEAVCAQSVVPLPPPTSAADIPQASTAVYAASPDAVRHTVSMDARISTSSDQAGITSGPNPLHSPPTSTSNKAFRDRSPAWPLASILILGALLLLLALLIFFGAQGKL